MYGLFYAMNEGQAKAYLSDLAEEETRATTIYGFVKGLVYLPASLIAGALWPLVPAWAFAFAIATSVAALALFLWTSDTKQSGESIEPSAIAPTALSADAKERSAKSWLKHVAVTVVVTDRSSLRNMHCHFVVGRRNADGDECCYRPHDGCHSLAAAVRGHR